MELPCHLGESGMPFIGGAALAENLWEGEPDLAELRRAHGLLATDGTQALIELKALADRGSTMSMVYLAHAYRTGIGTGIDLRQAEDWYGRAAKRGSTLASYELGRVCLELKRYADAKEAFNVGTAKSYAPSMHMLGMMYFKGSGVDSDLSKARDLLERSAALGHVFAKRNLAMLLIKGRFGLLQVPRGLWLLLSGFKNAVTTLCADPHSDRLR
jgi:TPR repeat protein